MRVWNQVPLWKPNCDTFSYRAILVAIVSRNYLVLVLWGGGRGIAQLLGQFYSALRKKKQRTSNYENCLSPFVRWRCAISLGLYPFERCGGTTFTDNAHAVLGFPPKRKRAVLTHVLSFSVLSVALPSCILGMVASRCDCQKSKVCACVPQIHFHIQPRHWGNPVSSLRWSNQRCEILMIWKINHAMCWDFPFKPLLIVPPSYERKIDTRHSRGNRVLTITQLTSFHTLKPIKFSTLSYHNRCSKYTKNPNTGPCAVLKPRPVNWHFACEAARTQPRKSTRKCNLQRTSRHKITKKCCVNAIPGHFWQRTSNDGNHLATHLKIRLQCPEPAPNCNLAAGNAPEHTKRTSNHIADFPANMQLEQGSGKGTLGEGSPQKNIEWKWRNNMKPTKL